MLTFALFTVALLVAIAYVATRTVAPALRTIPTIQHRERRSHGRTAELQWHNGHITK